MTARQSDQGALEQWAFDVDRRGPAHEFWRFVFPCGKSILVRLCGFYCRRMQTKFHEEGEKRQWNRINSSDTAAVLNLRRHHEDRAVLRRR